MHQNEKNYTINQNAPSDIAVANKKKEKQNHQTKITFQKFKTVNTTSNTFLFLKKFTTFLFFCTV